MSNIFSVNNTIHSDLCGSDEIPSPFAYQIGMRSIAFVRLFFEYLKDFCEKLFCGVSLFTIVGDWHTTTNVKCIKRWIFLFQFEIHIERISYRLKHIFGVVYLGPDMVVENFQIFARTKSKQILSGESETVNWLIPA